MFAPLFSKSASFFLCSSETSSSVMVYMDAMTSTMRTTTRPTTVTLKTTTFRTTTTRMPATTTAVAIWPRTTSTTASPMHTVADVIKPEDEDGPPPSSNLPNIRVEYCNPLVIMDVSWPKTRQGTVVKLPCPAGTIGVVSFMCLGPEGYWDLQGPDFSNCTSPWVNIINQKIKAGETAAVIARELAEQTKSNLQAGDITYTVRAMIQLVDLLDVQLRNLTPGGKDSAARSLNKLQKRERSCRYYVQAMVETVNNLLQPQAQAAWRELSTGEQLRAATMLLDTVEQGAFVLADNLLKTDIVQENTDNIQLEVARMSTDGNLPDLKFPQSGGQGNSIHLSANTLKQHGRNGKTATLPLQPALSFLLQNTDPVHDMLLDVITWVGILLSLVCLLISLFTFCFFRGLQSDRNTIHKNLCISLFIAESLFLVGINRGDQPVACAVFAALLHFFFLAAFTWMFLEGVQLYIMLVEVFESEHSRRRYFYLVGYGVPALIVAVSAAVDYRSYGTERIFTRCFPPSLSPFLSQLNVIFLGIALYKMFHHTAILKPDSGCLDNIKKNKKRPLPVFDPFLQVRKEYGKCLRTHCCSGKSVDSSIGSVKGSTSRTPGRYSSGSQSRIRRMWNDTVRKQSESSFMTGDINSSASLNREGILNNARDTSVMDTLPLNGNHGNSYSIASAEYMSDCVQIIDRGYNHKETTLEKKILKELTSNYIPSYLNNSHERSNEQNRNLMNKLVNNVSNGGKDSGYGMSLGLQQSMRIPQENSESFFPLLNEHTEDEGSLPSHSHQRDSLYNSMPMLPGLPDVSTESTDGSKDGGDAKSPEASLDDVYYKSMPNLGSRNHLHQLHSYYQLGRGSSDGFIAPLNREDLSVEEAHPEPSHLVTSL
uniref:Adhesion G protein-coupled receptor L3 n=1 Tax=Fundulus heteroclitus TaxID=8078 RepID=A0A3Q2Q7D5_FUNHE